MRREYGPSGDQVRTFTFRFQHPVNPKCPSSGQIITESYRGRTESEAKLEAENYPPICPGSTCGKTYRRI